MKSRHKLLGIVRHVLCLLLAAAMLAGVGGCGSDSVSNDNASNASQTDSSADSATLDETDQTTDDAVAADGEHSVDLEDNDYPYSLEYLSFSTDPNNTPPPYTSIALTVRLTNTSDRAFCADCLNVIRPQDHAQVVVDVDQIDPEHTRGVACDDSICTYGAVLDGLPQSLGAGESVDVQLVPEWAQPRFKESITADDVSLSVDGTSLTPSDG